MNLLGSLAIAFSMYSGIPVPQVKWTEKRMRYALCFFPMVGAVMGLLLCLIFPWAVRLSGGHELPPAVLGTVWPVLFTGGIHMDGFLDVTDARRSYGDKEKKLEILKDPHIGAFAAIGCMVYFLLYLAVFSMVPSEMIPAVGAVYTAERALSGLALVAFPKARADGLAAAFADSAEKRAVVVSMAVWLAASLIFTIWFCGPATAASLTIACGILFRLYYGMSRREFGGITGDLAGYFLQTSEWALLAVLAAAGRIW